MVLTLLLLQAPAPPVDPGVLTELDRVLLENVDLQSKLAAAYEAGDACRTDLAPYRAAENRAALAKVKAAVKARIEAAHPCCTYNVDTGKLEPREQTP